MALGRLLLALLGSPRLVEKLSESRPIRAAARLTAAAITRGQLGARQATRGLVPRLLRLRDAFLRELKDGARERGWPWPPGAGRAAATAPEQRPDRRAEPGAAAAAGPQPARDPAGEEEEKATARSEGEGVGGGG